MISAIVPWQAGPQVDPDIYYQASPYYVLYSLLYGLYGVPLMLGGLFWIWMVISCARNDPERNVWLWILIFVNPGFPLGAMIYFFIRWLPGRRLPQPAFLKRWTRGREIDRLEVAARQIGNAHQFMLYGEGLREVGRYAEAGEAFEQALKKDPDSLPSLWGAAQVAGHLKDYPSARVRLEKILSADPSYKFGDVSLAYARTLLALRENAAARDHLTQHLKRWKQPEAQYLLANLLAEEGRRAEARQHLQTLLLDLRGAPPFFVRQNSGWRSKAKGLLRKLPAA